MVLKSILDGDQELTSLLSGGKMRVKAVINLFAGPGVGKSTMAAELFSKLKKQHYEVELISEYAKDLTWEERQNILEGDQLYIFAKQHRRLLRVKDKVDLMICECPLLLGLLYYDEYKNITSSELFTALVVDTYSKYPNINFYIERDTSLQYNANGRNQNNEEAIAVDNSILKLLDDIGDYTEINIYNGIDCIIETLEKIK